MPGLRQRQMDHTEVALIMWRVAGEFFVPCTSAAIPRQMDTSLLVPVLHLHVLLVLLELRQSFLRGLLGDDQVIDARSQTAANGLRQSWQLRLW